MNTLFPWLSTYFESLIPGSFALGFNAGRETWTDLILPLR
ncbi:hypothetical protein CMEL01_11412 [Colletotrichum melonis]|uniref:Uncharacterized protein n=3 Tax=Colletotrichum acutatum species complex TaxID=2707335 RepID=A0AAI9YG16_9PEZI|nr:uncharacterized protein CCOS01_16257 [Colletotrichum costaricense]XP_060378898.1 uncharacterized protein CTAM01_10466 [Colletotrichum tamarilloi]KAK1467419.1 hypothetical protein CMEL01_11412 [Colletotrichum melonis]KAK1490973.1 hypothetical protein CTAM01_10466 [Colletotrichum tamarilloi]KAK1507951.1 hypothetical protein CCOS01_16257 [Colletotrichum costaricense]